MQALNTSLPHCYSKINIKYVLIFVVIIFNRMILWINISRVRVKTFLCGGRMTECNMYTNKMELVHYYFDAWVIFLILGSHNKQFSITRSLQSYVERSESRAIPFRDPCRCNNYALQTVDQLKPNYFY
uniref:Uncharacterized protein n=1 Tax=Glossina brevipalpis TaxID=37001 RepID=A0A1A9WQV4_9MUSC